MYFNWHNSTSHEAFRSRCLLLCLCPRLIYSLELMCYSFSQLVVELVTYKISHLVYPSTICISPGQNSSSPHARHAYIFLHTILLCIFYSASFNMCISNILGLSLCGLSNLELFIYCRIELLPFTKKKKKIYCRQYWPVASL